MRTDVQTDAATGDDEALSAGRGRSALRGRRGERETLDALLEAVRAGESRALVIRGEPGVGKSALLEYLVERASGCRVTRAAGVESEMELVFAGLHQVCAPLLEHLEHLPVPQREALATAFGMGGAEAPDRFLVALAALSLLSDVAAERPLICVVDDAQWLDRASAQALGFLARRLVAESVAIVFAAADPGDELSGVAELVVEGLGEPDARALLESVITGPLDERVRDRILAETHGNPLALLELPRGISTADLAGGFGLPAAAPLSGRIEESFRHRLEPLPAETRRLLLVAAAEPAGEASLVWGAAARLGIGADAAAPAAAAGLVEPGRQVRFRHPLVRSAVYRGASAEDRQGVHRALAEVTDPESAPDRRAWHRAQAAQGPDEDVAAELERSAGRAQARGGLAAAAAFLERAVALTLDPARRAQRALAAAQAKHQAGAADAALHLLATAQAGPLDQLQRARVDRLRGQLAFTSNRGRDAPSLLLAAARRLEPVDARLSRETYLDALSAALFAGRLSSGADVLDVAEAARGAPPSPQPPRPVDLLLDGFVLLIIEGYPTGAPILKRALDAFLSGAISRDEEVRWLAMSARVATNLWDDERRYVLSARDVELTRRSGALTDLPTTLSAQVGVRFHAGEIAAAAALIDEIEATTEATGIRLAPYGALAQAAWRGREDEVMALIDPSMSEIMARGEGAGLTLIDWAKALLYNGLGRYEEAAAAAELATERRTALLWFNWALPELIEAAARSGRPGLAAGGLEQLAEMTQACGTDWALGIEARSRALLAEGEAAESFYREAIERLGRTRIRVELARAHLLYGEWLRRQRRRLDARQQLHVAHEMLTASSIEAFAARAARELLATGETARKRTVETSTQLTARETQIARLARAGLSNPEIGARLFLSPRTVEYHLHKIFAKLDISSRHQLQEALDGDADAARPASLEPRA